MPGFRAHGEVHFLLNDRFETRILGAGPRGPGEQVGGRGSTRATPLNGGDAPYGRCGGARRNRAGARRRRARQPHPGAAAAGSISLRRGASGSRPPSLATPSRRSRREAGLVATHKNALWKAAPRPGHVFHVAAPLNRSWP